MNEKIFSIVLFIAVLILSQSCTSVSTINKDSSMTGIDIGNAAPEWVSKGIPGLFCGIGVSKVVQNNNVSIEELQIAARRNVTYLAKLAIAKHLKAQVKRYLVDHRRQIQYGDKIRTEEEFEDDLEVFGHATVKKAWTKGVWWTPKKDYVFLISCIDPEEFDKIFAKWLHEKQIQLEIAAKEDLFERLGKEVSAVKSWEN